MKAESADKREVGQVPGVLQHALWSDVEWLWSPWWISPVIAVALALLLTTSGCGRPPGTQPTQPTGTSGGLVSAPYRDPALLNATATFGPSVVYEGDFDAQAKRKPWSGYWYPIRKKEIFSGSFLSPSPLEKFDLFVMNFHHVDAGSVAYERDVIYPFYGGDDADSWAGLCNAWSMASLLSPEPTSPVTIGGVTFSVGDQKALLIKSFEHVDGIVLLGQRYNGDRDSVYDDIYADQFHRAVQAILFEREEPFVMDVDPGLAVWNYPFYRAIMKIRRDPQDRTRMHVDAWLTAAKALTGDQVNTVGTLPNNYNFTYDLIGEPRADGGIDVKYGEWTGRSEDTHPDFITLLPGVSGPVTHGSNNIKIHNDWVQEIVTAH